MTNIYQFVAGIEAWWLVAVALLFLAAEWIIIDIGIFLTLALTSFAMAGTISLVSNPIIVTWSFPVWLGISFLILRPILKLSSVQKDVYSEKNYVGKVGQVKALQVENLSTNHFYEYKNDMPLENNYSQTSQIAYRLIMKDGKELTISNASSLEDGAFAVVKTQTHDVVTVEIKRG